MPEQAVRFSRKIQRQLGIHPRFRTHFRVLAFILTVGECLAGYIYFRHSDFLGAYVMGSYLAKEKVISGLVRDVEEA